MKTRLAIFLIFAFLIAAVPLVSLLFSDGEEIYIQRTPEQKQASSIEIADTPDATITVFNSADGKTMELSMRDYLIGAVMSEMPAEYDPEALKAQTVACHTYARCVEQIRALSPDERLNGAAFEINTETLSGFLSDSRARMLFGDNYDKYHRKISEAVDEVLPYIMTEDGEPIAACYHAISPGRTENSENVFVSARSYLVAVDSAYDKQASGYLSTLELTPSQLSSLLQQYDGAASLSGEPEQWLGESVKSESGTVLSQKLGERYYTGPQLREAFSLRSSAFDAQYGDGVFTFTVRGYGHGVGMSQYGANCLAESGADYKEILAHYYTGAVLQQDERI